ncbi:MAG: sulfotransferase, partial [Sphingomonas bacterium]|uniref:sulfotransferase domain-containing protein n=1 Tax=Sphingomonas bacterium TaxID=1895847 RepID=UPI00260846CE
MADAAPAGGIDWIASYPKSGNTWIRLLLTAYFADDGCYDLAAEVTARGASSGRLFEDALGLSCEDLLPAEARILQPAMYRVLAARYPEGLWLKVHDRQAMLGEAEWLFPPQASGSAIYIIRDPRDVAVSNAFHDGHGDMDRAVAKLCSADTRIGDRGDRQLVQHIGDWSGHVRSWADQRDIPALIVRYEDMLADAAAVLAAVIRFARPHVSIDTARVARAVSLSRYDALQADEYKIRYAETPDVAASFYS